MTLESLKPVAPDRAVAFLVRRLTGFTRLLRENGFPIGVQEGVDALEVARRIGPENVNRLRWGWRSLLCTSKGDWRRFDELFDAYWLLKGMKRARLTGAAANRRRLHPVPGGPLGGQPGMPDQIHRTGAEVAIDGGGDTRREGASRAENLTKTDLRHIQDPDELAAAHEFAERLARRMRSRITRRERASRRGRRIDLRKVIHKSIAYGGLPLRLAFRKPKPKPVRLVLILDASGSMSQYSTFFLRFIRGVLGTFREAEAFVFHTRLIRISEVLKERNLERALERTALMTAGWAGGTKIGDSLATFNHQYAKRILNSRSVVIILSDGYDTGEPEVLAAQLAQIKRRAKRVVWLNPMIGWKGYEPVAGGMAAALPHIDMFAPAHNLKSLMALEPLLTKL